MPHEAPLHSVMQDSSESILYISDALQIPYGEFDLAFIRSGGPGGQHVNKTSTQVELRFDLAHSPSISDADRAWLMKRLSTKIDSEGVLIIRAQEHRSQMQNRKAAIARLGDMLSEAIRRPKPRKKSRPSKGAIERRLESKKKASETKQRRQEKF